MTKKVFFLAALALLFSGTAMADNDPILVGGINSLTFMAPADSGDKPQGVWNTSSTPALKIGEVLYHNWSASGNSQIDVTATFFGNYKYTHPKFVWDNIVDLAYGYAWQDLDNSAEDSLGGRFETHRKSVDKIDLTSSLSWKAYKNWGANFSANFKSQFGAGFEFAGAGDNEGVKVSGFMAPAYLTTALSFEYKRDNWSVSASFLTGKTTFVIDDSLIAQGKTYGVIQDDNFVASDPSTFNHAYFGLGSYVKALYLKKDILPSLDLYARLELFYDYKKPKNMGWGDNMAADSKYTLGD